MQIKIIRRLKDAFIFHFPTLLLSSLLSVPLRCSLWPLLLASPLSLDAYHDRFVSFPGTVSLALLSFRPLHPRGFCILFFGGATILILCSAAFSLLTATMLFTLPPAPPRCTEHSAQLLPPRFCFKRL